MSVSVTMCLVTLVFSQTFLQASAEDHTFTLNLGNYSGMGMGTNIGSEGGSDVMTAFSETNAVDSPDQFTSEMAPEGSPMSAPTTAPPADTPETSPISSPSIAPGPSMDSEAPGPSPLESGAASNMVSSFAVLFTSVAAFILVS